jgi:hypothetical protein
MADKFDELIRDLERVREHGPGLGMFGEESHRYKLNRPLKEKEVQDFEREHSVRLPADYREFLTRVGNGGAGPYYGIFKFGEMDKGCDYGPWDDFIGDATAPFPHAEAWNDLSGQPQSDSWENPEKYERELVAFEQVYFDPKHVNGAIPICHLGCAIRHWLVVTGSEAGYLWCDDRANDHGIYPVQTGGRTRTTFFERYRDWLNEALAKVELWNKNSSAR